MVKKIVLPLFLVLMVLLCFTLAYSQPKGNFVEIKRENFQKEIDGKKVDLYTIKNKKGTMVAKITNYGAKMVQFLVPDKKGKLGDIILGWENIDDTMKNLQSAGAIIGRYANRIEFGKFKLNDKEYSLAINDGGGRPNSLHGGKKGSRFVVFDVVQIDESSLQLNYYFKDGEEGFPGNCSLKVVYSITDDNQLKVIYDAVTDKPTVINFTQHNFWNLAGEGSGTILNHELTLNVDRFTPVNANLVPTGELKSVKGTPFDFTKPKKIGKDIGQTDDQLKSGDGYDHNFVLNKKGLELSLAGRMYESTSGRVMEVYTNEPGMQFFSGNNLPKDNSMKGKGGKVYPYRSAFCMETQHFPDSPNKPSFPSTVLNPGQWYTSTTIYKFSVKK
jgi:aldose 1-epimerase